MSQFIALLITGVVTGGIYAMLASGLVLTYVTSGVFNFAYGATAFSVAYAYYQLHSGLHWPLPLAAGFSLLVLAPLLGIALDRAIYRNLTRASGIAKIVTTIGVLVALPDIFILLASWLATTLRWSLLTQTVVSLPPGLGPYPPKIWTLLPGATISSDQLAVFAAAVLVSAGLAILMKWTRFGLTVRAAVDRQGLASLRGINPIRISTQTTVLGSVIAGLAGILIAPLFNLDPTEFTVIMFVAAAGAVVGRLRSIPIAMVGGLAIGVIQSLAAGYITISPTLLPGIYAAVPFLVLFGAVLLLGRDRGRVAGQVTDDPPSVDFSSDLPLWRRQAPWALATVALVVWICTASTYFASLTGEGIAFGIIFLSFVVITGAGGMVSLAQAAFATFGALLAAGLMNNGVPFLWAALVGALAAGGLGLVVALPSLRLGGLWLALSTLAAGFVADNVLFQIPAIQGASSGRAVNRPVLGPINFGSSTNYSILLLIVFFVIALLVRNLLRSPTGRLMGAVRSSQVATETSGASTILPKFVLFGTSAAIAGLGGTLLAANNFRIAPTNFPTTIGMVWLAAMAVFGVRRIASALIAGLMYVLFPQLLLHLTSNTLVPTILFGLGAISLAKNPDGMVAVVSMSLRAGRDRRREKSRRKTGGVTGAASAAQRERRSPVPILPAALAGTDDPTGPAAGFLELHDVRADYGGLSVLHGINLAVEPGTFLLIIGPNGGGKSTLCSVIAGLHPSMSGQVWFDGEEVSALAAHERSRRGLVLAPEYRGIFPGLTVEENISVWIRDAKDCEAALRRFPALASRRRQTAQLLSGGEQQMLTLAPLLEREPACLVADEPSLGLAPIATRLVFDALAEIRQSGATVVVAEEQARRALEFADRVVLLEKGRITWDGPAAEFSEEQAHELYLGKAPV